MCLTEQAAKSHLLLCGEEPHSVDSQAPWCRRTCERGAVPKKTGRVDGSWCVRSLQKGTNKTAN